jgi:DnaK suppressor protein
MSRYIASSLQETGLPCILRGMDPAEARDLLARERARIEAALAELAEPAGDEEADVYDDGDAAPELVEEGIDDALAAPLQEELAAVERAERRLAEGTYGLSVESGEQIPEGRLRLMPWAERTAEEQARFEAGR